MNDIFAVYKPKGLTSNAVLNHLRHAAHTKKIGHAGTLDPLAEGVLVVGVGRDATKQLAKEVAKEKTYRANYTIPTREDIEMILHKFEGVIFQIPPPYSAVKVKGKEAYKRVRKGEKVSLEPRRVEIKSITLESYEWPFLLLRVVTGPCVYIRSLARDMGEALGTGGYLSGLVRTRVGQWTTENALSLAEAEARCVV